jgi:hypothetical protein
MGRRVAHGRLLGMNQKSTFNHRLLELILPAILITRFSFDNH